MDLDHVTLASRDSQAVMRVLVQDLGATVMQGAIQLGFRPVQQRMGDADRGMTLELLEPSRVEEHDFLALPARPGPRAPPPHLQGRRPRSRDRAGAGRGPAPHRDLPRLRAVEGVLPPPRGGPLHRDPAGPGGCVRLVADHRRAPGIARLDCTGDGPPRTVTVTGTDLVVTRV